MQLFRPSIHKWFFPLLILLCGNIGMYAKPLSEKDKVKLVEMARNQYSFMEMDGASLYKFKGRNILLVITEVKKSPNAQRVGQVKASRLAGEFLQGAMNKSVTVYSVSEGNSYSFEDEGTGSSNTEGNVVSGKISQSTEDFTTSASQESFSDKIIQSSLNRVGHIEPLCKIRDEGVNVILAYFMIVEK